jgi:hypothetical protein
MHIVIVALQYLSVVIGTLGPSKRPSGLCAQQRGACFCLLKTGFKPRFPGLYRSHQMTGKLETGGRKTSEANQGPSPERLLQSYGYGYGQEVESDGNAVLNGSTPLKLFVSPKCVIWGTEIWIVTVTEILLKFSQTYKELKP